jgi:hypothetical protein
MRPNKTSLTILISAALAGAAICCYAQQGAFAPGGPQGPQRAGGQRFGAPMQAMRGGPMGPVDPTRTHVMELLQRAEVRSDLHLDIKQKAALDNLDANAPVEIQNRLREQFRNTDVQSIRSLPQEEQRAKLQELAQANRAQVMAEMQAWQGELTEKVKAILRPGQVKRLNEIDLQYRGVLSLTDSKVAELLKVSNEHRTEIGKIYGDFQSAQQQLMQDFVQKMRDSGAFGGPGGAQGARQGGRQSGFNPQEFQARMQPVQQKIEAQKKEAEEKVNALLSAEEKQAWAAAQGEKITFRKDVIPNGPRGNF